MTTATMFDGDFNFLPFRAHMVYGDVPRYPSESDFQMAAMEVSHSPDDAAAHWRLEAVRERRLRPAAPLSGDTLTVINARVAARLYKRHRDQWE